MYFAAAFRTIINSTIRQGGASEGRVRNFMALSGPSASELTVNVNFVDEDVSNSYRKNIFYQEDFIRRSIKCNQGYRATVPGRIGQTVHDVAMCVFVIAFTYSSV
jgi:hypothetical protein